MSNVLSEEEKQQIIALGKLGWSLRRIERLTGVRRETASVYLKAAGVAVRLSGGWGRRSPAKPANGVTTDPDPAKAAIPANPNPETPSCEEKTETAKPANEVTTDSDASPPGSPTNHPEPSASACEPYRELVEHGLSRGRKLRGPQLPEAAGINPHLTR
jgi:hypothetical protein